MDYEIVKKRLLKDFYQEPINIKVSGKLASAFMETRDHEGALEILRKAVEIEKNEETLTNLGYFYLYEGEPIDVDGRWDYQIEKSIEVLERALMFNPVSYMSYSVLGEAYLRKKCFGEAELVLRKAVDVEETVSNLNNLGVACYHLKKFEDAKIYFNKAHELGLAVEEKEDYSFYSLLNYGFSLVKLGQKKASLAVADTLIKRLKSEFDEPSLVDIGFLYFENAEYHQVIETFERAFKSYELYPEFFSCHVYALISEGLNEQAKQFYEKAVCEIYEAINDVKNDEDPDFKNEDRFACIDSLEEKCSDFEENYNMILKGIKPEIEPLLPTIEKDCYLFGCFRHHPE